MKKNVCIKRINEMFSQSEKDQLTQSLNKMRWLNLQDYESKKSVSFYDDDEEFYLMLSVPFNSQDEAEFDNNMLDLVDYLEYYMGITKCKIQGQWL